MWKSVIASSVAIASPTPFSVAPTRPMPGFLGLATTVQNAACHGAPWQADLVVKKRRIREDFLTFANRKQLMCQKQADCLAGEGTARFEFASHRCCLVTIPRKSKRLAMKSSNKSSVAAVRARARSMMSG
ncbi:hypothetical protein Rcae01_04040 [Novipirellula caenicola]|uniref:Secreted protein n=1 Tax=Novipirellula caenicola TaxID=1536901 RepID=A0ABP9VTT9_9BACT